MYIHLAVLFFAVLSSVSYAMEDYKDHEDKNQQSMELAAQVSDQQSGETNLQKAERQKRYNALVEEIRNDNVITQQLLQEGNFDEAESHLQKIAKKQDRNPLNPKKLTRYTKSKAIHIDHK